MLRHIRIRDFAIIDDLSLDLNEGMCVLTGETGAGKSILIDALGLVLGDRADSNAIRHDAKRMEISAIFEAEGQVQDWLAEHDMQAEQECIVRRVVTTDGRSRAYINGSITTLATLRELGELLVEIHGQHEHQSLLRRDRQREILDAHAQNHACLNDVKERFHAWQQLHQKVDSLSSNQQEREERRDLLKYQLAELESLAPVENELEELASRHSRLANTERLLSDTQAVLNALYEDEDSLYSQAARQLNTLSVLAGVDTQLRALCEPLESSQVLIQDCAEGLRDYSQSLETDPQAYEQVEQRLALYHELARKHRVEAEALAATLEQLQNELQQLEDPGSDLDQLNAQLETVTNDYIKAARRLSKQRRNSAAELSQQVTDLMQQLGMRDGEFNIDVQTPDDIEFSAIGLDRIEFRVSTNAGQPLKPLSRVASGGELSRISLALQVACIQKQTVSTLIFDEVDSGIGGGVAEIVGRKLRLLADRYQVLCVTHLPQVAAQGHHHYQVQKSKRAGVNRTDIKELDEDQRALEIARMLGGVELTENTQKHAIEMVSRARSVE